MITNGYIIPNDKGYTEKSILYHDDFLRDYLNSNKEIQKKYEEYLKKHEESRVAGIEEFFVMQLGWVKVSTKKIIFELQKNPNYIVNKEITMAINNYNEYKDIREQYGKLGFELHLLDKVVKTNDNER